MIQNSEARSRNTGTNLKNSKPEIRNPQSEYGFKVAAYDTTKDLIIDPLLASTLLGGSCDDAGPNGSFLTIASGGNVYVTGLTESSGFPTNSGAYDTSYNGGGDPFTFGDVFVSELSSNLTNLLVSTFLGGSSREYGNYIAIDAEENICVTGFTGSPDFPTTPATTIDLPIAITRETHGLLKIFCTSWSLKGWL